MVIQVAFFIIHVSVCSLCLRLGLREDDVDVGRRQTFVENFEIAEEFGELGSVHGGRCTLVAAERAEGLENLTESRHVGVSRTATNTNVY